MESARLKVTVAYARPEHQWLVEVMLPPGSTVRDAVVASGLHERIDTLEREIAGIGIGGKKLEWSSPVREGDRVEIYRRLKEEPRDQRRRIAREERGPCR